MNITTNNNYPKTNFKAYYNSFEVSDVKYKIKTAKNTQEASDIFESFIKEQTNHKKFWKFSRLSNALLVTTAIASITSIGATLLSSNPLFAIFGGGIGMAMCAFNKKYVIPEMKENSGLPQNENLAKIEKIKYFSDKIARGDLTIEELKNSYFWHEYYQLHKENTISGLLGWLDVYSKNTHEDDNAKLSEYIINNYDQYYWNELIPYCLRYSSNTGVQNSDDGCSYKNFIKLKKMSESVYYMYHNTIGSLQPELNTNNHELYKMFETEYPNNHFCDFLYNDWRRDENGIITDEEVKNFRKVFGKQGPHYALWVLQLCNNQDNHIAWDCAKIFQDIAHTIDSVLYNDYKDFDKLTRDMHLENILVDIREQCYDKRGNLDKNKFENLVKQIKTELDTVGIKNSRTLKNILDSYTRTKLGIFDDNIESIDDAINKPNRLYDEIQNHNSIAGYLKDADCTPSKVFGLLYKLTTTEDGKSRIIEEFSSNPRIGQAIKDLLIEKLGGDKKAENYFNTWFYDEKYGYRKAYANYYKHDLFENAQDLLTIVKQSPNIGTWAFKQKAASLKIEPTLGNIPNEFGTKEDFDKILSELTKIEKSSNSSLKKHTELIINDKKYFVSKIDAGHSAKAKYIIETNNGEKYVLKFSPYNLSGNTDRSKKFNDSFMLRGDSPYMDALVDFYLKENNCPNAPDIEYFDYNKKAILYKMTIGKVIDIKDLDFYNAYLLNNSDRLKDVKDLGVLINDINYKNILETPEGRLVIVDTGHSAYSSPFRPMVPGINIALSNTCGREMV